MKTEKPKELIILVDDAFAHGINQGFYEKVNPAVKQVTFAGINTHSYNVPAPQENQVYIFDPYNDAYLLFDENSEILLYQSKINCYIEVLGYMGAKYFDGKVEIIEEEKTSSDLDVNAGTSKARVSGGYSKEENNKLSSQLRTKREFTNQIILSNEEIERYLEKYHLTDDPYIKPIYREFKRRGSLDGSKKLTASISRDVERSPSHYFH